MTLEAFLEEELSVNCEGESGWMEMFRIHFESVFFFGGRLVEHLLYFSQILLNHRTGPHSGNWRHFQEG
jgi:hypothetical protein